MAARHVLAGAAEDARRVLRDAGVRRANIGAQFCAPRKFCAQIVPAAILPTPRHFALCTLSRWDDLFAQRKIDQGKFYASKDNLYPTAAGGTRRINWGWATVPPASTQTLPREITFNAAARALHQYPIEEVKALRGPAAVSRKGVAVAGTTDLGLKAGVAKQSEVVVTFTLPATAATLGVTIGAVNASSGSGDDAPLACTIEFSPPADASKAYDVPVTCGGYLGGYKDTLTLVPGEVSVELRIFLDWTMVEVYFQQGRVAMTAALAMDDSTAVALTSADPPAALATADVEVYPMKSIWTTADAVRKQKRVFG